MADQSILLLSHYTTAGLGHCSTAQQCGSLAAELQHFNLLRFHCPVLPVEAVETLYFLYKQM